MTSKPTVHVAVGVVFNSAGAVLVSRRHADSHQGGLWEFPGGKLESGETLPEALDREFREELGLRVHKAFPLRRISHHYEDKSVLLDTWIITDYAGTPRGLEGQAVEWRPLQALREKDFPVANGAIIRTVKLPPLMAITPQADSLAALEQLLDHILQSGPGLIQLRQKQLDGAGYRRWYEKVLGRCRDHKVTLLFSGAIDMLDRVEVDGYHSSATELMQLTARPVGPRILYSAACHTLAELRQAEALGADLALLSPVQPTAKYDAEQILGWQQFEDLASKVSLPVYALGGMQPRDLPLARRHGAFGIAGISGFNKV